MKLTASKNGRWSRVCAALGALLAGGLATLLCACASDPTQGYSFATSFRSDVATIAVPLFRNDTFENGLEVRLAQLVANELRRQTPYRVVASESAQTVLSGSITQATLVTMASGRETGLAEEQAYRVTVDFSWTQARTGRVLTARRNFSAARTFVPAQGVGERLEVGQDAALQQLARDIVGELRSGW
jgi:hypothetical protein